MTPAQIVLGTIIDKRAGILDEALDFLRDSDFVDADLKIWQAIKNLADTPAEVNLVSVTAKLKNIVPANYITDLLEAATYTASQYQYYAKELRRQSNARKLRDLAKALSKVDGKGIETAIDHIDSVINHITEERTEDSLKSIKDVAAEYRDNLKRRCESRGLPGVTTTYSYLDHLTGGFGDGQLVIIAGQPGMGKSAFVQNIQLRQADMGVGSVLFSLEMDDQELMHRHVAAKTGIDSMALQSGRLTEEQQEAVLKRMSVFDRYPLHIDDNPYPSVSYIKRRAKRLMAIDPSIRMIVIDYLQLLDLRSMADKRMSTNELTALATRGLKLAARELGIPIILLSQLNRQVAQNRVKIGRKVKKNRPTISNLRDSGAIEQDADTVLFVYRECEVEPNADPKDAEVIVAKCRGGKTGTVYLTWDGPTTQFLERDNLEPVVESEPEEDVVPF